ncbi:MAG: nicotinate-nucleotide--dimethylbenzimidazole phosphoribosyltransferase [Gammaproteobacteria bacterium]|nr:nicotinate-nucleotide--dimethylbenzimidazole phosphoribosyltransferase [Gammaproteobacteria bacterium]
MNPTWLEQACMTPSHDFFTQASEHQTQLTKPPGALGKLEDIAIKLASLQNKKLPEINSVQITVFAADHGIANQGVSAFPQAVTAEMIKNFARGGAAINVLARANHARLNVVNLGTAFPADNLKGVIDRSIAAGTNDFSVQPAMSVEQCITALSVGAEMADEAHANKTDLFIAGEMGIANTSSATAVACVLLGRRAQDLAGPGTGLNTDGVSKKADIINQALALHDIAKDEPLEALETFGGFEIAAIAGSYIRCAQLGIPVLVDGFISSIAALVASRIKPSAEDWFIYAHASAEPGHQIIMRALDATPILDLSMRLGEGSGAALVIPIIKSACALHAQMATFAEAGVSEKSE